MRAKIQNKYHVPNIKKKLEESFFINQLKDTKINEEVYSPETAKQMNKITK